MSQSEHDADQQIAVIGMAGRFPGAADVEAYWRCLRDGVEAITFWSVDELRAAGIEPAELERPDYVRAKGMLEGREEFDAAFFGISPREAELMDPQQRLFLECAWHALEHAGHDSQGFEGPIALYGAKGINNYLNTHLMNNPALPEVDLHQLRHGNRVDNLATRTAYLLDLEGPCVTVQTGCSSSLVATHLACQSLLAGEADLALAGGVRINNLSPAGYRWVEGFILSPDGHTRSFDARAGGTVGGDGVGIVVLRRLEDALEDGDTIYAVIRGSAVNNDGAEKIGYTAPAVRGQAGVIREALAVAGVEPEEISYVEAHGTATPLGDPIEVRALTEVFGEAGGTGSCALGSVKSNIGHLDAASGAAGLIKTVLALHHRQLPPSLHFERPNPELELDSTPFRVQSELGDWPASNGQRRAGVSSFGIGGTNAHVVLEQASTRASRPSSNLLEQLLVLSAKSDSALERRAAELADHLERHPELDLGDVASTLHRGRRRFEVRRALVAIDLRQAVEKLREDAPPVKDDALERPVAFLFPGQGAQHVGMARGLYENAAGFRADVDACCDRLVDHLDLDLRSVLFAADEETEAIHETVNAQPTLFVVEYALARHWMRRGIEPWAMAGHSLGEYVAACLAGVFELDDALALVAARARLMQDLKPGAMLAVPLDAEELAPRLGDEVELAAINAPRRSVVAGSVEAIDELAERLAADGVAARRLAARRAFHSRLVEPALERVEEHLRKIEFRPPRVPFLSNVTGTWIRDEEATDPSYWLNHMRRPVRFADNLAELLRQPGRLLLEVGPGRDLGALARRVQAAARGTGNAFRDVVASLDPAAGESDVARFLAAAGRLWTAGAALDGEALYAGQQRRRLALPLYPFERQRYWIDRPRRTASAAAATASGEVRKRSDIGKWFYVPSWRRLPSVPAPVGRSAGGNREWVVVTAGENGPGRGAELVAGLEAAGRRVRLIAAESILDADFTSPVEGGSRILFLAAPKAAAGDLANALLSLVNALDSVPGRQRLVVAGGPIYEVIGGEKLLPDQAVLAGLAKAIAREAPDLPCRMIDFESPAGLLAELLADIDEAPPLVALRGRHRWVPEYAPLELPAGRPRWRSGGVYLIGGGTGRIGRLLAGELARRAGARLVLTGRAEEPPTGLLDELRELGGEAVYVAADVADVRNVRTAVDTARQRFGRLDGVIHAAGVTGEYHALRDSDPDFVARFFAAKVEGSRVLAEALAESHAGDGAADGPDFVLLLSSLSAVLGGIGYGVHAAAHAVLDARAELENRRGVAAWIACDLDGWNFSQRDEEEPGEASPRTRAAAAVAALAMTPREGIEALWRVLDSGLDGRVVVSTGDLGRRFSEVSPAAGSAARSAATERQEAGAEATPKHHERPASAGELVAPQNESEELVAEIWSELFAIEPIGADDDFFELGGDSLLAIQLASRLREAFDVEVPIPLVFASRTVSELAREVEEILVREIGQLSDDEARELLAEAAETIEE